MAFQKPFNLPFILAFKRRLDFRPDLGSEVSSVVSPLVFSLVSSPARSLVCSPCPPVHLTARPVRLIIVFCAVGPALPSGSDSNNPGACRGYWLLADLSQQLDTAADRAYHRLLRRRSVSLPPCLPNNPGVTRGYCLARRPLPPGFDSTAEAAIIIRLPWRSASRWTCLPFNPGVYRGYSLAGRIDTAADTPYHDSTAYRIRLLFTHYVSCNDPGLPRGYWFPAAHCSVRLTSPAARLQSKPWPGLSSPRSCPTSAGRRLRPFSDSIIKI